MSTDMKNDLQTPSPVTGGGLASVKGFLYDLRDKAASRFYQIRQKMDSFNQIMVEGHYNSDDPRIVSAIFGWQPKKLPITGSAIAGRAMLGTGQTVAKRIVWGGVFAFFAITKLALVGAVSVVLGSSFLAKEFKKAKKARTEIVEEVNVAGQMVRGRRADLCRLHYAQMAILDLPNSFKPGSKESTSCTIIRLLKSVERERQQVTILDAGRNRADQAVYDFSEHRLKLVNENPGNLVQTRGEGAAPADLFRKEIADVFNSGAVQFSDELIEKLADVLMARMAQRQNPPSPKSQEVSSPPLASPSMPPPSQAGNKSGYGLMQ